jgi:hypothetical protein
MRGVSVTKQHYFIIFGQRNNEGVIEWSADTEMSLDNGHEDRPIYNTETSEWESLQGNEEEDGRMFTELAVNILPKNYLMVQD